MTNYEVTYIIKPDVEEEARTAIVERYSGLIANNGTLGKVDDWGKRQLAYEIEDYTDGHYIFMEFSSEPDFPKELERQFKINENIIRYLVIKL